MIVAKFDGYTFGDKILEGVYFQADFNDSNGQIAVNNIAIHPSCDGDYWKDLNMKKWLKRAEEHIKEECQNYKTVQDMLDDCVIEL